jgi:hypothetical protein
MSNSLFVGNGINRCTVNNNIAWNDLLGTLATEFDVEHNEKLSFPLDFECIANQLFLKHCRDTSYNVYQK